MNYAPLIAVMILAGCVTSPVVQPQNLAMPPSPAGFLRIFPRSSLWVSWTFAHDVRDTLEARADVAAGPWEEIPGPYVLIDGRYAVEVVPTERRTIYRVRRSWGDPNLAPGTWPDAP